MADLLDHKVDKVPTVRKFPVIDTDHHPGINQNDAVFLNRLPERWREYMEMIGVRFTGQMATTPTQRSMTHRLDSVDESGRTGVSIPLIREQVLDKYDVSGAVITSTLGARIGRGGGNCPQELACEISRAANEAMREHYLEADPRFYGAICAPVEVPAEAVKEIQRLKEGDMGHRWVEMLIEPGTDYAMGNPKYWPVYEALEHYDIPISVHVSGLSRRSTGTGQQNYYFEAHCNIALRNYSMVPSMVFEGVFDRFPNLKMTLTEQSWSWAVPLAWRMDATYNVMRREVSHLQRKPSEYIRDHFYFHTQPLEETEFAEDLKELWDQFLDFGLGEHLMFATDYPHWDFDSPYSLPAFLGDDLRRSILADTASRLYHIPLLENSGISLPA